MKKNKLILFLISVFFILGSCSSIKKGLVNDKKNGTDEFLIKKKSPLVLPPSYGKLPLPNKKNITLEETKSDNTDIQKILNGIKKENKKKSNENKPSESIEELILKKINKN